MIKNYSQTARPLAKCVSFSFFPRNSQKNLPHLCTRNQKVNKRNWTVGRWYARGGVNIFFILLLFFFFHVMTRENTSRIQYYVQKETLCIFVCVFLANFVRIYLRTYVLKEQALWYFDVSVHFVVFSSSNKHKKTK